MMSSYRLYLCVFLSLLVLGASQASAAIIPPPGLNPGDHYRLVFVTSGSRDATSSNIEDYNAFVTSQAQLSGSITETIPTTWKAIASTSGANARVNTATDVNDYSLPIYNLAGQMVAAGNIDLWDGSLAYPILFDQSGGSLISPVWTGTMGTGSAILPFRLGSGNVVLLAGNSGASSSLWMFATATSASLTFPLYGISGELTVPSPPVPEPTSLLLFGLGSVVMLGAARFRRKLTTV